MLDTSNHTDARLIRRNHFVRWCDVMRLQLPLIMRWNRSGGVETNSRSPLAARAVRLNGAAPRDGGGHAGEGPRGITTDTAESFLQHTFRRHCRVTSNWTKRIVVAADSTGSFSYVPPHLTTAELRSG